MWEKSSELSLRAMEKDDVVLHSTYSKVQGRALENGGRANGSRLGATVLIFAIKIADKWAVL